MTLKKAIPLALTAIIFVACQKGENDPFFTLISRKQRLSGNWKATAFVSNRKDTNAVLNGDSLVITLPDSSIIAMKYSLEFVFNPEGTYTQKEVKISDSLAISAINETDISGDWEFTGGNNSPSKSKLVLFERERQQTDGSAGTNIKAFSTSGQAFPIVFDLNELRKNKVVLTQNIIESEPFSSDTTILNIILEPQ